MFLGVHKQISKLIGGNLLCLHKIRVSVANTMERLLSPFLLKFLEEWADLFIYNKISGLIKNGTYSELT